MSFKHKFPTSVMMIGYLEDVRPAGKGSSHAQSMKMTAKLYNPSESNRAYDLRVPCIAIGKAAASMIHLCKTGELVCVRGRTVMRSTPKGVKLSVLIENIKSLDEPWTGEEEQDEKRTS